MKILLTGGTGYIGWTVLTALLEAGHAVTAIVRTHPSSLKLTDQGATCIIGDLFDAQWLAAELRGHDAAIHTAAGGDERDAELNDSVITAAIDAFSGTDKPFIHTGGIWTYGANSAICEEHEPDAPAISSWRAAGERRLLESGVKASVIQPGIVYGRGSGIPAMLVAAAAADGATILIGSGDQHWPTVHVDDLAELYVRALTQAPGGKAYVAVSGENPTVRELGEALSDTVVAETPEATIERLGAFSEALLLDQQATGTRARHELGWLPTRPSLVDLLRAGYTSA